MALLLHLGRDASQGLPSLVHEPELCHLATQEGTVMILVEAHCCREQIRVNGGLVVELVDTVCVA